MVFAEPKIVYRLVTAAMSMTPTTLLRECFFVRVPVHGSFEMNDVTRVSLSFREIGFLYGNQSVSRVSSDTQGGVVYREIVEIADRISRLPAG